MHEQRDRPHGREEWRRLKLTAVRCGRGSSIEFPHAQIAVCVQRRRRSLGSSTWENEIVYAVTDLTWRQARPQVIAEALRGHWASENRLH